MITVNDFFCGAGGVGIGFREAGCEIIWACDFDKFAVQTYRHNVGNHVIQADIKQLTAADIPQADIWAFGFPCQDLSTAGQQRGFEFVCDDCGTQYNLNDADQENGSYLCPNCRSAKAHAASRSGMFFEMMRLLDETQADNPAQMPLALFIENVKGLRKYIPVLEQELIKRGYEAKIRMFNSKYWGVPQNRERYYIVGLLDGITGFQFPAEQHNYVPKLSTILETDVAEKYYIPDERAQKVIQQALEKLPELGSVHATLTPDRIEKRQNGPRAKADEQAMFTLTAQDVHGVIIQTPRGNNTGGIHDVAPTLTGSRYEQNNLVCEVEDHICRQTGLLNPNGVARTLRVKGDSCLTPKHNYQYVLTADGETEVADHE